MVSNGMYAALIDIMIIVHLKVLAGHDGVDVEEPATAKTQADKNSHFIRNLFYRPQRPTWLRPLPVWRGGLRPQRPGRAWR